MLNVFLEFDVGFIRAKWYIRNQELDLRSAYSSIFKMSALKIRFSISASLLNHGDIIVLKIITLFCAHNRAPTLGNRASARKEFFRENKFENVHSNVAILGFSVGVRSNKGDEFVKISKVVTLDLL